MTRVQFLVATAALLALAGGSLALAEKPETARVMIVPDQKEGAVRFVIDGQEQARIDATGLHVVGDINYGGALTDTGRPQAEGQDSNAR